jgi:poly(3-hydroxybutyrate) depolymerase
MLTLALAGGVAAAAPNKSAKRKSRSSSTPALAQTNTEQEATAPYAVRTVETTLYDAAHDRTILVTVYAPDAIGAFPLVVLVHGYAAAASDYETLDTEVAAAGFVVAAPDFPLSSRAVTTSPSRDIVDQATDVSFVLDQLLNLETVPTPLFGSINDGPVAVMGHSDGGVTAAGVAFNSAAADPRIAAAVVMSGGAFGFSGSWFTGDNPPALLAIHGTADTVNPYASSQSLYDDATGARWLVSVNGGSHAGPFTGTPDGDPSVLDVGALIGGFLHAYLEGDATAAAQLPALANTGALSLAP